MPSPVASNAHLMLGDCIERMKEIDDGSVHLICTDPPYFKVKGDAWDNQWKTPGDFLDWMGRLCAEWRRVLAPNGSLYVFASPRMAARVECKVGEWFEVLNQIVWSKADTPTHALKYGDDRFRQYVQKSERIIFAEQSDGFALRPLRDYLDGERMAARLSRAAIDAHIGTSNVSQYWWQERGFIIPTAERYRALQEMAPGHFLRDYESISNEYEALRRPFAVSADVPYADVWDFPAVPARRDKHVCEKPLPLISHIVAASSRPGDTVLDCFMGSGVTGEAAESLGRSFIGIEQDPTWFERASRRIDEATNPTPLFGN